MSLAKFRVVAAGFKPVRAILRSASALGTPISHVLLPFQIANGLLTWECWMFERRRPNRHCLSIEGQVPDLFGSDPTGVPCAVHLRHESLAVDRPFSCVRNHGFE